MRYALNTFAGRVDVVLDVKADDERAPVTVTGPDEAVAHVRADVEASYGDEGHLLEGNISRLDLRIAMSGPRLQPYAPQLIES